MAARHRPIKIRMVSLRWWDAGTRATAIALPNSTAEKGAGCSATDSAVLLQDVSGALRYRDPQISATEVPLAGICCPSRFHTPVAVQVPLQVLLDFVLLVWLLTACPASFSVGRGALDLVVTDPSHFVGSLCWLSFSRRF